MATKIWLPVQSSSTLHMSFHQENQDPAALVSPPGGTAAPPRTPVTDLPFPPGLGGTVAPGSVTTPMSSIFTAAPPTTSGSVPLPAAAFPGGSLAASSSLLAHAESLPQHSTYSQTRPLAVHQPEAPSGPSLIADLMPQHDAEEDELAARMANTFSLFNSTGVFGRSSAHPAALPHAPALPARWPGQDVQPSVYAPPVTSRAHLAQPSLAHPAVDLPPGSVSSPSWPRQSLGSGGGDPQAQQPAEPDARVDALAAWVEDIVCEHGGVITSANLGSTLSSSNSGLYRVIKLHYGGLCALLSRFPKRFVLADNPPFNHVMISPSSQMRQHLTKPKATPQGAGTGGRRRTNSIGSSLESGAGGSSGGNSRSSRRKGAADGGNRLEYHPDLEKVVIRHTREILQEAAQHSLKAVELANTLRARLGTEVLACVREKCGGLLSLLEKHTEFFKVQRIPKSDTVTLVKQHQSSPPRPVTTTASSSPPPISSAPLMSWASRSAAHTALTPHDASSVVGGAAAQISSTSPPAGKDSLFFHPPGGVAASSWSTGSESSANSQGDEAGETGANVDSDPALAILTSELCVPTRAWPMDSRRDWPFVQLITDQLAQLGGGATVSKLRGLMKDRLQCTKSIKSVPLKAFLVAYKSHFFISGNRVTLVRMV
mmetsp:Transcript_13820/g.40467  ORF Transcript_13820/g.40467 Transcript_13820/m.40467 type:complete len:656 (-) Transcript_13820:339-2306(-)